MTFTVFDLLFSSLADDKRIPLIEGLHTFGLKEMHVGEGGPSTPRMLPIELGIGKQTRMRELMFFVFQFTLIIL